MNILKQHRLEHLKNLGIPNHLFQELFGDEINDKIKQYLSEPNYFYAQGWPDNPSYFSALSDKTLLPLWECGEYIFAVDISNDINEYIQFHVEFPEEYEVNGNSIYSSLLSVIEQEYNDGATNDELLDLLEIFKMPKPNELFTLITQGNELDDYKKINCDN